MIYLFIVFLCAFALCVNIAADVYWWHAHKFDGLLDPRVLRPVRERVQKLRASR